MPRRINLAVVGLLVLGLGGGCGAKKVDVTGRVTYQGKQVMFGAVFLVGTDGSVRECILRSDGTYLIPQVPVGSASVAVTSPNPAGAGPEVKVDRWFPIPEKYSRVSTSPLRIEVSADAATYDLNLE